MNKTNNDKKIEDIVDSFDTTMKKGYISALILMVLESEQCHGYKIQKEIGNRTCGVWQPNSSTIYPLLDSLSKKGLIKCIKENETGRQKKTYGITTRGKKTLKMLLQKHSMMIDSIKSIVFSTIGITDVSDDSWLEEVDKIISVPEMNLLNGESDENKIETLKYNREMTTKRIKILNNNLEMIEKMLTTLEGGVKIDDLQNY